jgi:5-methylthioadenosine/S-adenosylhomocysteine deaminase
MRGSRSLLLLVALCAFTVVLVISVGGQSGRPVDLVVSGGTVVTMNGAGQVIPNGAVVIDDGRIEAVGAADDIARLYDGERIDARGQIVLPGLINTHTHAPMVLFRGLADDYALAEWLTKYIFPAEAKTVTPDFVQIGTRLAALEMIESGTTTFADMYYFEDDIASVTREAGLRAVLGQSVIKFPVKDAPTPEDALIRAEAFIAKWHRDPRITPAVAPHAPTTVEPATLRAARALANKYSVPLLIHLAETRDEVTAVRSARGASPTQYLESLGLWEGRSLAAHAVWLDDADMRTLARRRVGVSHNPESNMKLASGIAAVPKWIETGMLAGLGTDGAASNNDLDMFEAMRVAALLHKVGTMDPQAMPARQALELATRRGAAALGLGEQIGSLEPGKQADLITVNVDGARQTPLFDAISHVVYVLRGEDVRTTIVAGEVLMRERRMTRPSMNRESILRDARAMAQQVRIAVATPEASTRRER